MRVQSAILSAVTTITTTITVAAGVFAPGHLGELTWQVPFELADAVLEETRARERRLRELPSRVGVYFVLGAPRGAVGPNGGGRPSSPRRRSGGVKLEAASRHGSVGRAGAASTKSRRFSTAGWAGRGERDGKVYARNRCRYAS